MSELVIKATTKSQSASERRLIFAPEALEVKHHETEGVLLTAPATIRTKLSNATRSVDALAVCLRGGLLKSSGWPLVRDARPRRCQHAAWAFVSTRSRCHC